MESPLYQTIILNEKNKIKASLTNLGANINSFSGNAISHQMLLGFGIGM